MYLTNNDKTSFNLILYSRGTYNERRMYFKVHPIILGEDKIYNTAKHYNTIKPYGNLKKIYIIASKDMAEFYKNSNGDNRCI